MCHLSLLSKSSRLRKHAMWSRRMGRSNKVGDRTAGTKTAGRRTAGRRTVGKQAVGRTKVGMIGAMIVVEATIGTTGVTIGVEAQVDVPGTAAGAAKARVPGAADETARGEETGDPGHADPGHADPGHTDPGLAVVAEDRVTDVVAPGRGTARGAVAGGGGVVALKERAHDVGGHHPR